MRHVNPLSSIRRALFALAMVMVVGTTGYLIIGFPFIDALYQTVTTVTTVGFREVHPIETVGEKLFTMALVLAGVGTAFYTFGVSLEALVEGHLRTEREKRRMDRTLEKLHGHVIVCGWGRVGRACGEYAARDGTPVVVVDRNPDRLVDLPYLSVAGDVTDDEVLRKAGVLRASSLVAALETDADNVYVTLSGRALRPDLTIIARARTESSEPKLVRAGADHVVNPQRLGGDRMAAFAVQPHIMDFLDVVMHDGSLEIRIEEARVAEGAELAGKTLAEAGVRDRTGAQLLAVRGLDGTFLTNPASQTRLAAGQVLIGMGTAAQVAALRELAVRRPPEDDQEASPRSVAPPSVRPHGQTSA
ncbi:MAG: voltage-gated potassium channel [Frankiaceae bacterium]|jgi:voltage-gated potassium channel|nr:voltage-gated potassium channel [Frankiaceae bacterium]MDQ1673011.1 voltage-gated potassium channel [Frankiaceae bacterium]